MMRYLLGLLLLACSVPLTAQSSLNFSSTVPAAPTGYTNITWQRDHSNPVNISGYLKIPLLNGSGAPTLACSANTNANYLYTSADFRLYQCLSISGVYGWRLLGAGLATAFNTTGTDGQVWGMSGVTQGWITPLGVVSCASGLYMTTGTLCAQVQYSQLGGSVPTWNQSTSGNAATATRIASNGTASQVWSMDSGGTTQGWNLPVAQAAGSSRQVQVNDGANHLAATPVTIDTSGNVVTPKSITAGSISDRIYVVNAYTGATPTDKLNACLTDTTLGSASTCDLAGVTTQSTGGSAPIEVGCSPEEAGTQCSAWNGSGTYPVTSPLLIHTPRSIVLNLNTTATFLAAPGSAPTLASSYTGFTGYYQSGITVTGTVGQTCQVTAFNNSATGAVGTLTLTGTNTVAQGTTISITTTGSTPSAAPTSATAGNGTATCSGTITLISLFSGLPAGTYYVTTNYRSGPAVSLPSSEASIVIPATGGNIQVTGPATCPRYAANYDINIGASTGTETLHMNQICGSAKTWTSPALYPASSPQPTVATALPGIILHTSAMMFSDPGRSSNSFQWNALVTFGGSALVATVDNAGYVGLVNLAIRDGNGSPAPYVFWDAGNYFGAQRSGLHISAISGSNKIAHEINGQQNDVDYVSEIDTIQNCTNCTALDIAYFPMLGGDSGDPLNSLAFVGGSVQSTSSTGTMINIHGRPGLANVTATASYSAPPTNILNITGATGTIKVGDIIVGGSISPQTVIIAVTDLGGGAYTLTLQNSILNGLAASGVAMTVGKYWQQQSPNAFNFSFLGTSIECGNSTPCVDIKDADHVAFHSSNFVGSNQAAGNVVQIDYGYYSPTYPWTAHVNILDGRCTNMLNLVKNNVNGSSLVCSGVGNTDYSFGYMNEATGRVMEDFTLQFGKSSGGTNNANIQNVLQDTQPGLYAFSGATSGISLAKAGISFNVANGSVSADCGTGGNFIVRDGVTASTTSAMNCDTGQRRIKTGSTVASNATIAPLGDSVHVTGGNTLDTITPGSACVATGFTCYLNIYVDGAFKLSAAGNIEYAVTPTIGQVISLLYDNASAKWWPTTPPVDSRGVLFASAANTDTVSCPNNTQTNFATTYTVPASYLVANKLLRITLTFTVTSSGTPPSMAINIKAGAANVYTAAPAGPTAGLTTRSTGSQFLMQGTDVAGSAVAVYTTALTTYPGTVSGSFAPFNSNTTVQPVNLATNGTLVLQPQLFCSANTAGNSATLQQFIVEALN